MNIYLLARLMDYIAKKAAEVERASAELLKMAQAVRR